MPSGSCRFRNLDGVAQSGWGYCVIRNAVPAELVATLTRDLENAFRTTPISQGLFYGPWTRRFHSLLRRSKHMEAFVRHSTDNGATLVWPGSHRRQDEILIDPAEAIVAEMEPGSALLFLGSTLHSGGANRSAASRRGMIVSYSLGWLKPYELPWLAYPPHLARTFSPELAALAGYRSHRPNLGTYEGRCPSWLLRGNGPAGAIDSLLPEQEAAIAEFYAKRQNSRSDSLNWRANSAENLG